MKSSLHVVCIFFFTFARAPICCAMVRNILIQNDSCKKYTVTWAKQSDELPGHAYLWVPLAWRYVNKDKTESGASIEFLDTADPFYEESIRHRFFSFILYSHMHISGNKKIYTAQLERKRPEVSKIREMALELYGDETLRFIIADNLEESQLKLED
jgi:hypothetical protein